MMSAASGGARLGQAADQVAQRIQSSVGDLPEPRELGLDRVPQRVQAEAPPPPDADGGGGIIDRPLVMSFHIWSSTAPGSLVIGGVGLFTSSPLLSESSSWNAP